MKFHIFVLLFSLMLLACGGNEPEGDQANEFSNEVVDSATVETEEIPVENHLKNDMSTPAGKVIHELYASSNIAHYFCEDGSYWRNEDGITHTFGEWKLKGDEIEMVLSSKSTLEGKGDPLPMPEVVPGNYITQYADYDSVVTKINETETLDWSEIKQLISEDPTYPYAIQDEIPVCPK